MALIPKQLSLFEVALPYKYIIDTSAILSQKPTEQHRRNRFTSLWNNIDELMQRQIIVVSSENLAEVGDKDIMDSLKRLRIVELDIDEEIQEKVATVVTKHPRLIDFKQNKSSGDAFLIATAMKYGLTVITEENQDKQFRIPSVCRGLDVGCINILGLCELEDWRF